jgi:hypothetical protein
VAAGFVIGAVVAVVVRRWLQGFVLWVVRRVERITDPLLGRFYPNRPVT